jgi:hypothetical protein
MDWITAISLIGMGVVALHAIAAGILGYRLNWLVGHDPRLGAIKHKLSVWNGSVSVPGHRMWDREVIAWLKGNPEAFRCWQLLAYGVAGGIGSGVVLMLVLVVCVVSSR